MDHRVQSADVASGIAFWEEVRRCQNDQVDPNHDVGDSKTVIVPKRSSTFQVAQRTDPGRDIESAGSEYKVRCPMIGINRQTVRFRLKSIERFGPCRNSGR
jgi:hypothetical protein